MGIIRRSKMRIKKNAKRGICTAIVCMSIVAVRPVAAFIWPTIDAPQIGAFATSLQDGVTQVNNLQSQIQNATATINTVGDQATSALKYTADLKGALGKVIPGDLINIATDIGFADLERITDITAEVQIEPIKNIADNTVTGTQILLDDDASEEDIQELLDDARDEIEENKNIANQNFDEVDNRVIKFSDEAQKSVDQLIKVVEQSDSIKTEERAEYISEAEDIQKQIKSYKSNALDILQNAKEQYNAQNKNVLTAYDAYSIVIGNFYENKATREDVNQAGEQLKQTISETGVGIDNTVIARLTQSSEQIIKNIEGLKEKVINRLANSQEYPEEDLEKTSWIQENDAQKFVFSYKSQKQFRYAKSVYEKDNNGNTFFIMPEELTDCKAGEKFKVADIDKEDIAGKIRKNLVCTRMEKTFWCPDDPESKSCRPYKKAKWNKYEKNGVYHHMLEDYLAAGNVTRDKTKQLVNSWAGSDEKSTYTKLNKMIETAGTDTRKMYQALGLINLETTKLWSWVRRNDAMDRGQSIIERLGQADQLYLGIEKGEDEADELVQDALKKQQGFIKGENTEDGKIADAQVFSDVFLYACEKNSLKAEDVSVEVEKKYDADEIKKKEKQIADCLFKFAEASSRGTIDGKEITGNKEADAKLWRRYRSSIMQDTAFQTLYLSILGSYKSVKDLKTKSGSNSSDATIISLQKGINAATVARDDYTAGAEVNYYATIQVLDILDAEAQSLQTEILQELPKLNYNSFAKDVSEEGGAK